MKNLLACLVAYAFLAHAAFAGAINPPGVLPDAYGNVPRAAATYSQTKPKVVCSGTSIGAEGAFSGNLQTFERRYFYCPNGATSISILMESFVMVGSVETDNTVPMYENFSVEIVCAPWNASTSYTTGQCVTWSYGEWTATGNNTGSAPGGTNSDWATFAGNARTLITCKGQLACQLESQTRPGAQILTQAVGSTDLVPFNVPVGGFIAVNAYTVVPVALSVPYAQSYNSELQECNASSTGVGDRTATGILPVTSCNGGLAPNIAGIVGIPQPGHDAPAWCVVGDSISSGTIGNGFESPGTINSGGTGYTSADVNKVLTNPNTGAGTYGVGDSSQYMITGVSGGAITNYSTIATGGYAPSLGPSGVQTLTGTTIGSGFSINLPVISAFGFDAGDYYNGIGWEARAFDLAGIPYAKITRSSDTVAGWVSRSYSRQKLIQELGCSSVIVAEGTNDLLNNSAASVEANYIIMIGQIARIPGVRAVYGATIIPRVSSTNGYVDTANQTDLLSGKGITFNSDMRANYASWGLTGVIDVAPVVESSPGSGKWSTNGSINYNTVDGVHPSQTGHANMAAGTYASFAAGGR